MQLLSFHHEPSAICLTPLTFALSPFTYFFPASRPSSPISLCLRHHNKPNQLIQLIQPNHPFNSLTPCALNLEPLFLIHYSSFDPLYQFIASKHPGLASFDLSPFTFNLLFACFSYLFTIQALTPFILQYFTNTLKGREKERGIKIKMRVKLAAKLLVIAWTIMKTKKEFDPALLHLVK